MFRRLGRFPLTGVAHDWSRLSTALLSTREGSDDLLSSPDVSPAVRYLAAAVHEAFVAHDVPEGSLALDGCAGAGEACAILASHRGLHGEVRPRDILLAGVAVVRRTTGATEVQPRLLRVVCANGSMLSLRPAGALRADPRDLRAAIAECLQPATLERGVELARRADSRPLGSEPLVLQILRDFLDREILSLRPLQATTRWGLHNALTAAARREPDLWQRLDCERRAAWLLDPVPADAAALPTAAQLRAAFAGPATLPAPLQAPLQAPLGVG